MRLSLMGVVLCGCSSILGIEDPTLGPDAAGQDNDATGPDANVSARQWGEPVRLVELDMGKSEVSPAMSADMLRICFVAEGPTGTLDIFCAERPAPDERFGVPEAQSPLNTTAVENNPTLGPGGELFFSSDRNGNTDLFRSVWNGTAFESPTEVTELSTGTSDSSPGISSDGLTLYYSQFSPSTQQDLFVVTRPAIGSMFGTASELVELNSDDSDDSPAANADESFLVFSSTRDGATRLFGAERDGARFLSPAPLMLGSLPGLGQSSPEILSDGSLLFAADSDLFIAPPAEP